MGRIDDLFRKYTVKVNDGSGCLIQPNTLEFTYILTAKHCIQNGNNEILAKQNVEVYRGNEFNSNNRLEVLEIFPHSAKHKDAVILKVEYVNEDISLVFTSCKPDETVTFAGYPFRRRDEAEKTDVVKCEFKKEMMDERIEVTPNKIQFTYDGNAHINIKGFSGGGVFKVQNDDILLVGIVSRLADDSGSSDNILTLPISYFAEIVEDYDLPALTPKSLTSFEPYKEIIWKDIENCLRLPKAILEEKAEEVISKDINPIQLIRCFGEKLFVPNSKDWRNEPTLWAGWLELLTYCNLVKSETSSCGLEFVKKITENFLFLYNCDESIADWTSLLKIIIKMDLYSLKRGSKIITNTKSKPGKTKLSTNFIVREISNVGITGNKLKIDKGINIGNDFTFIHLREFKNRIMDNDKLEEFGYGDDEKVIEELKSSVKEVMQ